MASRLQDTDVQDQRGQDGKPTIGVDGIDIRGSQGWRGAWVTKGCCLLTSPPGLEYWAPEVPVSSGSCNVILGCCACFERSFQLLMEVPKDRAMGGSGSWIQGRRGVWDGDGVRRNHQERGSELTLVAELPGCAPGQNMTVVQRRTGNPGTPGQRCWGRGGRKGTVRVSGRANLS